MIGNFEAILPEFVHRKFDFLISVTAFIRLVNVIVQRLDSHLHTCDSQSPSILAIFISHIFRSCLYRQSDNSAVSSFVFLDTFFNRLRIVYLQLLCRGISGCLRIIKINLNLTHKLMKVIARIIESFDKSGLILSRIDIPCSSQHNHLNFVSRMSCKCETQ